MNEEDSFDGSVASLIANYRNHAQSPIHKISHRTRTNYRRLCTRIERDHGDLQLRSITAERLKEIHQNWGSAGHAHMTHDLITMLRTLTSFGITVLNDPECARVRSVIQSLRFPKATSQKRQRIAAEQVHAFRDTAHRYGLHSLALAQAIQFECNLAQTDVIGEWVPISQPGSSDITKRNQKWLRGLRWTQLDESFLLRCSVRSVEYEIDLNRCQMVMEEISLLGKRPVDGPMIVSDSSLLPWTSFEFRRRWRQIADAAGIPKNVFNMDSRDPISDEAIAMRICAKRNNCPGSPCVSCLAAANSILHLVRHHYGCRQERPSIQLANFAEESRARAAES